MNTLKCNRKFSRKALKCFILPTPRKCSAVSQSLSLLFSLCWPYLLWMRTDILMFGNVVMSHNRAIVLTYVESTGLQYLWSKKKKKSIGGLWLTYLVSGVHICFGVWRLWEYIMFHSKHKGETRGGSSVSQNNGSAVWRDNGSWIVVDNHCIFWYVGIIKQIHYLFFLNTYYVNED